MYSKERGIETLFGNVAAGEVHPQLHIPMFGNRKKNDFS
jgi:hypothetical protein